jgi:diketogulonate reductase-like aldo/keto reductase
MSAQKQDGGPSIKLNTGADMPVVTLGTWKAPKGEVKKAVIEALKIGYRGLDCACDYGNEEEVGEAIKEAIAAGYCKREDLFITSKLWNTYHRKEHVEAACKKTLADLGLDYLDLYLIHFPISLKYIPIESRYPPEWMSDAGVMEIDPVPYRETWEAMQELQEKGLSKAIGVSNLSCHGLQDVLSYAKIPPAVNQVELHPYLFQESLVAYNKAKGVVVTAFSPLGSASYASIGMDKGMALGPMKEPAILKIAEAKGKSAAQVILRWHVQRGLTLVPKSTNPERLAQNLSVFDFELSADEVEEINKLDRHCRFNDPGQFTKGMGDEWKVTGYPIHN